MRPDLLGRYLLKKLHERGIRHLFGIPGDFALNFFKAIEQYKKIQLITLSHEPGLGFAADGLSRITGHLSAVAITFGAGAFNIVNPIACAYAEKSPLVVLAGAPAVNERGKGILFHHQAKSIQSQRNVFQEITSYQAILEDLDTAAEEIEKALVTCEQLSSPVYIEIPSDRVFQKLPPDRKFQKYSLPEDLQATREAATETLKMIEQAKNPVLMVGVEVQRFGLRKPVVTLAEKLKIPVVSSFLARSTYPVDHPLFAGTYLGPAGDPRIMKLVEKSDCLILLGVLFADTNMALRLSSLNPRNLVRAISRQVSIGHHSYEKIPLRKFVSELQAKVKRPIKKRIPKPTPFPSLKPKKYFDDSRLDVEAIVQSVNYLFKLKGNSPVIADNGDCLFASVDIRTHNLLASGYYATMGFAVPAGLGVQLGSKKRPLILVGDGAFQMTGMEICHSKKLKLNPIVIIFNNHRWEMLQTIQPDSHYFDLTPWNFSEMAKQWGGLGIPVRTKKEMLEALLTADREKNFVMIDANLPLGETSRVLKNYLKRIRN